MSDIVFDFSVKFFAAGDSSDAGRQVSIESVATEVCVLSGFFICALSLMVDIQVKKISSVSSSKLWPYECRMLDSSY